MRFSGKWIRRFLAAAVFILLCLTASGCGREHVSGADLEKADALRERLQPLEEEQKNLRQEIVRRKREEGLFTGKTGVGELIVLGADPSILSDIVPRIRDYSAAAGTFAFSDKDFPGLPGKFGVQEYLNLKKEGWSACLYWDGTQDLDHWLSAMEEQFRKVGEPLPEAVVFAEGSYAAALEPVLEAYGICIAVHHGESGFPLMCGADMAAEGTDPGDGKEHDIWHPGACGYYDMVSRQKQDYLEQAEDLHKNIIYTVCVAAEEGTASDAEHNSMTTASSAIFEAGSRYEDHPFAQFMGYWDKDTKEGYLTPKGLYEARDYLYRCSLPEADAELLDDEIRAKRQRIDEIDAEMKALYEEYYRENESVK